MKRILAAMAVMIGLAGCGGSSDDEDAGINLSGTWDVVELNNGSWSEYVLTQAGSSITGTMAGIYPVAGQISGSTVTWTLTLLMNHSATMNGALSADGNRIEGTWVNDGGAAGTFVAYLRESTAIPNLSGTWFSIDASTGVKTLVQLTHTAAGLTGTSMNDPSVTFSGTVAGTAMELTEYFEETATKTYYGILQPGGNVAEGTWDDLAGSGGFGWTFVRY